MIKIHLCDTVIDNYNIHDYFSHLSNDYTVEILMLRDMLVKRYFSQHVTHNRHLAKMCVSFCIFLKDNEEKDLKSVQIFSGKMYRIVPKGIAYCMPSTVFEIFVDTGNICFTGQRYTS